MDAAGCPHGSGAGLRRGRRRADAVAGRQVLAEGARRRRFGLRGAGGLHGGTGDCSASPRAAQRVGRGHDPRRARDEHRLEAAGAGRGGQPQGRARRSKPATCWCGWTTPTCGPSSSRPRRPWPRSRRPAPRPPPTRDGYAALMPDRTPSAGRNTKRPSRPCGRPRPNCCGRGRPSTKCRPRSIGPPSARPSTAR